MITISADQIEANASVVLKELAKGERIGITFGSEKTVKAYLVPGEVTGSRSRKLGILEGKGTVTFADDFKITEEEFLGL
ncbi:hypothetical protein SAMN04487996_11959 [Dyadobacter soli]|uniref:Prevent-host-death family protein n=1 Tax=Dyadobacter soli TaxID=659014 RepID=A0A1G7UPA9_9BACT|nr:hypothetical protein [Dyadobacter soli]SDG49178.1 hypothetical protein SAMN04487996_11959 [Dyadobacter soli]